MVRMTGSWGRVNVLSKDEQIAYCSLALIPSLHKRQADLCGKIQKGTLTGGNGWDVIADITVYTLSAANVPSSVRIYGYTKLTKVCP